MSKKKNSGNSSLDVVGIGNAIVDIIVQTDDKFLTKNGLTKGSMVLMSEEQAQEVYDSCGSGIETSGGSAANTLAGIAQLGGKAGFIGRVKSDQLGTIFAHDIRSVGAQFDTPPIQQGPSTARCVILVTPDAQRTMCTYLGASVQLEPNDLDLTMVKDAKILYLEGYLWDSPAAKKAFVSAAKACLASKGKVSLSLSDSFCVNRHRKSFQELVDGYIDILFANESEITALYETSNVEDAIKKIQGRCEIAALTFGKKGSAIVTPTDIHPVPAINLGEVVDTTGAGDLYASGFLYGLTQNETLLNCAKIASICAGQIVTQFGPRSRTSLSDLIKMYLK
nr:adenosine kinase [Prochlorococcus sp. MIT 1300]